MGESRGGGRGGRRPTTDQIARALIKEYQDDGREVERIHVQHATAWIYLVEIETLEDYEPERFMVQVVDDPPEGGPPSPSGGLRDGQKGSG